MSREYVNNKTSRKCKSVRIKKKKNWKKLDKNKIEITKENQIKGKHWAKNVRSKRH